MATDAHTEHPGGKPPFPPFNKETFASQLVWLVIFFVALYVIISKLAIPRLGGIIERYAPENEVVERFYVIQLQCAAHDEAVVRTKLLQAMNVRQLRLHGLESKALKDTGNVEVEAVVYSARQEDAFVEHLVGDLSASPNIFSTKWTSTAPPE